MAKKGGNAKKEGDGDGKGWKDVKKEPGAGKGAGQKVLPGDWTCPACGVNNFASRTECFKCSGGKDKA